MIELPKEVFDLISETKSNSNTPMNIGKRNVGGKKSSFNRNSVVSRQITENKNSEFDEK